MTCRSALMAVPVFERTRAAEPEKRLLGVGEGGWSRRRTGRAWWRPTPGAIIRAGITGAACRAEPSKKHRDKCHDQNECWIGQRQKVEPTVHFLGHLNRVPRKFVTPVDQQWGD